MILFKTVAIQSIRSQALFPLSLLLLLPVTACDATSSDAGDISSETTQPPAESIPVEEPLPIDEPIDDPDALPAEELTGVALALSGEGVLVVDQQSGKTQTIPFETDLETSQTAISASLGEPTETAENGECGAGPMSFITWSNGFTLNAMENQFVGWTVRPETESANLTTLDGVGLGSTLVELEENYDVGVIESSLGTEFNASNSLFGLLDANEPDGMVTYLWAGVACNFR
ncbi:hypothetical protein D0962_07090 [Leptolyngbyaceae cyanobacterium CCMR0082]|uniref:Uncharacterized protein n=2 Tax=Adonisia turfae TaxID=2950184 RepID=A0A6M0S256_9CYAN|nr:hypothetical protein [Adonisia turfae]NEZ54786.1 hypothetical protein [Adonisia turfae CCMR0081]NEZ62549.1 hypothetical protein [Adonisia turfae CCMR0082]